MDSIKTKSVVGGAWTFLSQGTVFGLRLLSTAILARILTPFDYGLIAMALVISNFAKVINDFGLTQGTVQSTEITQQQLSNVFWINVGVGIVLTILIAITAPLTGLIFEQSELPGIQIFISVVFFFGALSVQHKAILQRKIAFKKIAIVEIVAKAVAVAVGVYLGLNGFRYWALAAIPVANALMVTIGMWVFFPWLPGRLDVKTSINSIVVFGKNVTAFNVVNYLSRNADSFLVGKFLGSQALGLYSKAYSLLMLPVLQIQGPLTQVGFAALSRLKENPQHFRNYYLKMVGIIAFLTAPLVLVIGLNTNDLILVMLGEQWLEAGSVFQILALAALLQPISGTIGMVLIAKGDSEAYFRLGVATAIVNVGAFLVGIQWGIAGVAFSFTISNYLRLLPTLWYGFRHTSISVSDFFKVVQLPFALGLVASGISHYLVEWLQVFAIPVLRLILATSLSFGIYGFLFWILPQAKHYRNDIQEIFRILFRPVVPIKS